MFSVSSFYFYLLFGFQRINFTFSGRINQLFERKTTHNRCKSGKIVKDELPQAVNACVYFSVLHFWSNYVGWLKPMYVPGLRLLMHCNNPCIKGVNLCKQVFLQSHLIWWCQSCIITFIVFFKCYYWVLVFKRTLVIFWRKRAYFRLWRLHKKKVILNHLLQTKISAGTIPR